MEGLEKDRKRLENTLKLLEDSIIHHNRVFIKIKDKGSIDDEVATYFIDLYNRYTDIYDKIVRTYNERFSQSLFVYNSCQEVNKAFEMFKELVLSSIHVPENYQHPDDRLEEHEGLSILEKSLDSDIPILLRLKNINYEFIEEEAELWLDLYYQHEDYYNRCVEDILDNYAQNDAVVQQGLRVNEKKYRFEELIKSTIKFDLSKYVHPDDRTPDDDPPPRPRLVHST